MFLSGRKRLVLFLLGGLAAVCWGSLAGSVPTAWAATSRKLPLNAIRSNDCTGEEVHLTGIIHLVSQLQSDGSVVGHFNYQGVRGTGLTSGIEYRCASVDHFRLSAPFPSSITSVRGFRLISPSGDDNLLVLVLFHITVNDKGEVMASIEDLEIDCR